MIERSPLAPVFLAIAFSAIASKASSVNLSSTPSISNNFWYCFTNALLGSVRIFTRASLSNGFRDTLTGTRPMNSGINPNFTKSSGRTCFNKTPTSFLRCSIISAWKPIDFFPIRFSIIFSRPSKAPPQINKIFVVSI